MLKYFEDTYKIDIEFIEGQNLKDFLYNKYGKNDQMYIYN